VVIEAIAGADGIRRIPEHCADALSTDAGPAAE
jgi:hypothetical protein